jgi:hypothetical protein
LLDTQLLVNSSSLWISHPAAFRSALLIPWSPLLILLRFLYVWWIILLLLSYFSGFIQFFSHFILTGVSIFVCLSHKNTHTFLDVG